MNPGPARWLIPFLAGAAALALYASTAAPWLAWAYHAADGGDLVTASMTWGVPHPTGYPTYCLLGRLWALLPLGGYARRYNLFSAATAAGAIALLAATAQHTLSAVRGTFARRDACLALAVGLLGAVGELFWSQAVVAEVYAPAGLFFAALTYLAFRPDLLGRRWAWGLWGLLLGLGLGAHLTLLLAVPGLGWLMWPRASRERLRAAALGLAAGLTVFAYLPLASMGDPPVNWGEPHTLSGLVWLVTARLYHGYAFALPREELLPRLAYWARLWVTQYGWVGAALGLVGLWAWLAEGRARWAAGTVLVFVALSVHAIAYRTADSFVYLMPAFWLAALWVAAGAQAIVDGLTSLDRHAAPMMRAVGLVALLLWPLVLAQARYPSLDLSQHHEPAQWLALIEAELPHGALLLTGSDEHTFTLDYARWVEGRRTDLIVVDGDLWVEPWYRAQLARRHGGALAAAADLPLAHMLAKALQERPVYLSAYRPYLSERFVVEAAGPLWRLDAP